MPPRAGSVGLPPVGEYGTMHEISVQMLPDGRSLVETYGSFWLRILERGSLDGYTVGRIERYVFYITLFYPPSSPKS
jgi:Lon protease-like protein